MFRLRVTYTKSKEAAYIPASDLAKVIETALTRAGIYIEYTKDNDPDIKFADNISLGIESTAEICDIAIKDHAEPSFVIKGLNQELPVGMVALTAYYLEEYDISIDKSTYAVTYEISPDFGNVEDMTNREYSDKRKSYRFRMEEYLAESNILVLVKTGERSERIDIKPAIMNWKMSINDAIKITISKNTEYVFNPNYIMDGFKEFTDDDINYTIKRIKILCD